MSVSDRRRKLPATTLLLALWGKEAAAKIAKGEPLTEEDRRFGGMSPEEILNFFYKRVSFAKTKKGWTTAFDPTRMKSMKMLNDLVDAKTGKVMAEAGSKMTPRVAKKLQEQGLKEQLVQPDEMLGRFSAGDLINESTGEIFIEAGDEITQAVLDQLDEAGIKEIATLNIDNVMVRSVHPQHPCGRQEFPARQEALIDIYRVMRPGEPPTLDTAKPCSTACSSTSSAMTSPRSAA